MAKYSDLFNPSKTNQGKPIPGRREDMVRNQATGYTFKPSCWTLLERFLILGTDSPTYYADAKKRTLVTGENLTACIAKDGVKTVAAIIDVSRNGRAAKNDHALFALAVAATIGNTKTRRYAMDNIHLVARTGSDLFMLFGFIRAMRSVGRVIKRGFANWLNQKSPDRLAYQMIKYRNRHGYTWRDLLRLVKPRPKTESHDHLFAWQTGKPYASLPSQLIAYETLAANPSKALALELIPNHRMTWEMVPTRLLREPEIWDALTQDIPITALIRNLGRLSNIGLISPMSEAEGRIAARLVDPKYVSHKRLHPVNVLVALHQYRQGKGGRGRMTWEPSSKIIDALDEAFYLSFGNVEPTHLRTMLALDVSGSMDWPENKIHNMAGITAREAAAAMALVTAKIEPYHMFVGFTAAGYRGYPVTNHIPIYNAKTGYRQDTSNWGVSELVISKRQRLDDIIAYTKNIPASGTDCAAPMIYAMKQRIPIDVFCIYTDNETWAGTIHPSQALQQYKDAMGIDAKVVVIAMTSNEFSIADPMRTDMLDCVGMDTNTPSVISGFSKGDYNVS